MGIIFQSTVVMPHGVNFQLAVRLVEEVCSREQEHASIQLQPMAGKTVASLEQPTSHRNVAQSNVQVSMSNILYVHNEILGNLLGRRDTSGKGSNYHREKITKLMQ